MRDILATLHPESRIAGFARNDHRVVFFNQINALIREDMTVLDFGAGRGKWADVERGYKLELTTLKGKCREVIGVDIDDAVLTNPLVDRGYVVAPAARLPIEDDSIDLIISWAVLEHVEDPDFVAAELTRVLRPGGWFCAVTPSRWSYFAIGARFVPNKYHAKVLARITRSSREDADVFPTVYKMNTIRALTRYFPGNAFENFSYYHNGPPSYHGNKLLIAQLWRLWMWLLPKVCSQQIHVFFRKRTPGAETNG